VDEAAWVSGFAQALVDNPVARTIGDVTLRYEPSMMVGETEAASASWRPVALSWAGFALIVGGLASLLFAGQGLAACLIGSGGVVVAGSSWLERREKRKRGFVLNFATSRLRLDFVTPFSGKSRTLLVPFDAVKAVELREQADGAGCLTVDFLVDEALFREVLIAFIPSTQADAAQRFTRLLEGAFGLGSIPPDSPFLEAATQEAGATPALGPSEPKSP